MSFGLGYKRDKPDARDKHFASLGFGVDVPEEASLKDRVLEVLNQGNTSSCVAHAWTQALRITDMVEGVNAPPLDSRLFHYFGARKFDGGPIEDGGTQLRSAAQSIVKFGRPSESAWPFDEAQVNNQPPWEAFREGFDRKGPAGYYRVSTVDEIRQAIAAGKPVVGGTEVGESIFSYTSGTYDPDPAEAKVGGHALCFCGYFANGDLLIVGSWGPAYGESGFMRVSARWAATFSDCWAVH